MVRTSNSRKEGTSSVHSPSTMHRISRPSGFELDVQKRPCLTEDFKPVVFIHCRMTVVEGRVSRVSPSQAHVLRKLSREYDLRLPITVA